MPLSTTLYIQQITHLSDARYCAGMGVDLLGFNINPHHPDYVSPEIFREITGWVSGPSRVVQIAHNMDPAKAISDYSPDLIHLIFQKGMTSPVFPTILEIQGDWSLVMNEIKKENQIKYVTRSEFSDNSELKQFTSRCPYPVLVPFSGAPDSIHSFLQNSGVSGLILQGSPEIKPGLKDYDQLTQILEVLEN